MYIYRIFRTLWLFARIVWRDFDSNKIPDPYRSRWRMPIHLAWEISTNVWVAPRPRWWNTLGLR
jgi:hypothetical protein